MATTNYYNTGDEWMQDYKKDSYRFMKKRAMVRNVAPKLYSNAERAYSQMEPEHQKQIQRKLRNLQKKSPNLVKALAAKKPSALVGLAKNLRRNVHLSTDWVFILLFSFGLLKDIFDIAFAALGAVPVVGPAGTAIGIIISFVGELMFLILTVTALFLAGSSFKNRGIAKYFVGTAMEFIAEALPGISWLPWTPVYVLVLYLFVLYDRAYQDQGAQSAATDIPSSGAADNYYADNRLAA